MSKNPPHIHAAVIKAWADGQPVEVKGSYTGSSWGPVVSAAPVWDTKNEYRVKPAPLPYAAERAAFAAGKRIEYRNLTDGVTDWTYVISPAWAMHCSAEYRVQPTPDAYKVFRDAIKAGKKVEFKGEAPGDKWVCNDQNYGFICPPECYRVQPEPSKYQHLIDAMAAGKTIQLNCARAGQDPVWQDRNCEPRTRDDQFAFPPGEYRIKPATASYRKAIMRDLKKADTYYVDTTNREAFEPEAEKRPGFVRWLGDRITIEV